MSDPEKQAFRILTKFFLEEIAFLLKTCHAILMDESLSANLSSRFEAFSNIVAKMGQSAAQIDQEVVIELSDLMDDFSRAVLQQPERATEEHQHLLAGMVEAVREHILMQGDITGVLALPQVEKIREILVKINEKRNLLPESRAAIKGVSFDPSMQLIRRTIEGKVQETEVTSKEAQIFSLFREAKNHAASRQEVLDGVWGATRVNEKAFSSHLSNLRHKIMPLGLDITLIYQGQYQLIDTTLLSPEALALLPTRRGRKRVIVE